MTDDTKRTTEHPWRKPLPAANALTTEQWKEAAIQTIGGCLLDGTIVGFSPLQLLLETYGLLKDVKAGTSALDRDWLEGRKEYPTSREPNHVSTRALRWAKSWLPGADEVSETFEEWRKEWKEEAVQTIAGCLLDGVALQVSTTQLLEESTRLYGDVVDGKAGLDIDWLEGRKEYPTSRQPGQMTSDAKAERAERRSHLRLVKPSARRDESLGEEEEEEQERSR